MSIDLASGNVQLQLLDFRVAGKVDLAWDRHYNTFLLSRPHGILGRGWTSRYCAALIRSAGGFEFIAPNGSIEKVTDPHGLVDRGERAINLGAFLEVFREHSHYVVRTWDVNSGNIIRYLFAPEQTRMSWRLGAIEESTGERLVLDWSSDGKLTRIRQPRERRALSLSYSPDGLVEEIVFEPPAGGSHTIARYEYDSARRLIAAYDAADSADRYDYDLNGRLSRQIVKDGGVFSYHYDRKDRCVLYTGLDRYDEKRLRFMDAARTTELTDSYGRRFLYQYLPSGQITRETDPLGSVKHTEYDAFERISTKTDANGGTTTYSYDANGNRSIVTDALGNVHRFSYNEARLPVTMTDPLGHEWRREYDRINRVVAAVDPLGNTWTVSYDDTDDSVEIKDPLGRCRRQYYSDGLLASSTDWLGNVSRFRHDGLGRVIERTGPEGAVTRFRFDVFGNPTETSFADGTIMKAAYDSAGNLIELIDGKGQVTRYVYGPCNRLLERRSPTDGVIRYVWGTQPSWLDKVVNESGETYEFHRDEAGRVVREVSFDGAERHFGYDVDGYMVTYQNANGELLTIERNAAHRVVSQILPDGSALRFKFDQAGRLVAADNDDIKVTFERDPLGRVIREVQGDRWVHRQYDATGNIVETSTSAGHHVERDVDANGYLSRLITSGEMLHFTRGAYGQETRRQVDGGVIVDQQFDALRRLIDQEVKIARSEPSALGGAQASQVTIRRKYSYAQNGAVMSVAENRSEHVRYVYDPADRLLQVLRHQGPTELFSHDAAGNITRVRVTGSDVADTLFTYTSGNRLARKGDTVYEYDREGRRIAKIELAESDAPQIWRYEWDVLDRLRAVTRPDGETWRYKYDALARRVAKTGPGKDYTYVWDGDVMIQELEGSQLLATWMFDSFSYAPLATIQGSRLYVAVNDHLGTPRELLERSGAVGWSVTLKAWGEKTTSARQAVSLGRCQIRFQGQWHDEESSLHYNRFRYYDPECATYISQDPIGLLSGKVNLYAYVTDPNRRVDPLGLMDPWDIQFTQPTISDRFTDGPMAGTSLNDAIAQTKAAGKLPPGLELHVMELNGGQSLVTLNNRTLYVAQQAGIQVSPTMVGPEGINQLNKLLDGKAPLDPGEQPEVVCKK